MNVWCGDCYIAHPNDPFPVQPPLEEEEGIEAEAREDIAHKKARDGDHLMGIPFECDLCHFRNLKKRDPILTDHGDAYMLMCIRRAVLDALWSRSSSTVKSNLARVVKDYQAADITFGLKDYLPQLGWPVLEDRVGMGIAIVTLMASLRPGKYTSHLQYDSMRRTPTWFKNAHSAGSGYNVDTLYAQDDKKVHATSCVTAGEWFVRFKLGTKYRMGQIRKQNEAFTPEIIHALDKVAQEEWENSTDEMERKKLEELMSYILMEFCGNLRGEEVPRLSLSGLLTFWEETISEPDPYIMLTLHGKFKGEGEHRWHCIPIPIHTRTHLPVLKWIRRMIRRIVVLEGRSHGWVLADNTGRPRKLGYYDPLLIELLDQVKTHFKGVISPSTEVEDFSLWRSGRRGATTEAHNQGVPQSIIDLMGRWRSREAAKGAEPGLPMRQVYTQVKSAVNAMLLFAKPF
jgi:hypothetical protein